MAIDTTQPEQITAGNTLAFTFSSADYPPDTYTITYRIVGASNSYSVTGTDNGDGTHLVSATAATTAAWAAGEYRYYITASSGSDRYTAATGALEILPDPAIGGFDGRSHVKIVLDALEATLEGKATNDQVQVVIAGRSITKLSPGELREWRDHYKAEYAAEMQAERIAKGLGSSRKIKVRIR